MTSDPDGEVVEGGAVVPYESSTDSSEPFPSSDRKRLFQRSVEFVNDRSILVTEVMPLIDFLERSEQIQILSAPARVELETLVTQITGQSSNVEMSLDEFWEMLATVQPKLKAASPASKRKSFSSFLPRSAGTPISSIPVLSRISSATRRRSGEGVVPSPKRLSSYGVGGLGGLAYDAPSFSSNTSGDLFFTPTGKLDDVNTWRLSGRESPKFGQFGDHERIATDRSWSPRSSLDGSSSNDSSSPRKALFSRDEYAFEAIGGASETEEEEEAVRQDRAQWKKKCSDLTRRLHETDRLQKQADDRVHELEHKLSEVQQELFTKKKESFDQKGRNDGLMTQIDSLESSVMSLKEQLSSSRTQCTELRTQLDNYKERADSLRDASRKKDVDMQKLAERIDELEDELQQTLEEKIRLENDLERLGEELESSDEAMRALKAENVDLRETIETLRVTIEGLERHQPPSGMAFRTPGPKGKYKSLRNELDSAYGSAYGSEYAYGPDPDDQDSDEKFTQSQRAITFSEEAYNFDVIWNRAGSSDASVQVQPDTQSLSIQTAQLSVTSTAAQMDNEPPELDASEGQTVYHATSTQTDETALFWARELAAASALRIKCEELERVLEERERQVIEITDATEAAASLQSQNEMLREQILEVQRQVMETRQVLNARKHYDKEMERWIDGLKKDVQTTEDVVRQTHSAMDDESDQQARLRERIKELEDAIASQKDAVLESCAVPTKVETASVSVQTDDSMSLYELPTMNSDIDWDGRAVQFAEDDEFILSSPTTPAKHQLSTYSTIKRRLSRLCLYSIFALGGAAVALGGMESDGDVQPIEQIFTWLDRAWVPPDGRVVYPI